MGDWTLFSNHGHVLLYLAGNSEARLRDVAGKVGITERAVQKIVKELQEAGYLAVTKHGRCNRYRIHARKPLRHPIESHCTVAGLVKLVCDSTGAEQADQASAPSAKQRLADAEDEAEPRTEAAKEQPSKPSREKPAARKRKPAAPESESVKPESPKSKSPRSEAPKSGEEAGEPADSRQQGSLF